MTTSALLVDPDAPAAVRIGEVPEPVPNPDKALAPGRQVSVNLGDLRYAAHQPPGTVLGYDASGVVLRAATDGTGPVVGTRVVAFGPGAWAQRAAFATANLLVVPDFVDLARAGRL